MNNNFLLFVNMFFWVYINKIMRKIIKITKIIIINILLFFVSLYIVEYISYNFLYSNWEFYFSHLNQEKTELECLTPKYKNSIYSWPLTGLVFNNNIPYNNSKRPILLLGCSYTVGYGIDFDENFSSQLQQYTKRKVHNIATDGFGIDGNLKRILYFKENNILKHYNYEYIIYTLMYNHVNRMTVDVASYYLTKNIENNKNKSLKSRLIYFLDKSYLVKLILARRFLRTKYDTENIEIYKKFLIDAFIEVKQIVQNDIPDAKFYILFYNDLSDIVFHTHEGSEQDSMELSFWEELKDEGYNFITTKDLVGDVLWMSKYQIKEDPYQVPHHPNEKAWEIIVPALSKKLKL